MTSQTSKAPKSARPMPAANVYMNTAPFWEAAQNRKLLIQKCPSTSKFQFFPRPGSVFTGRRDTEWTEVSGDGVLYAWTTTNSAWPGHEKRVPYICAYVTLAEGVRLLCNLFNPDGVELKIGMPLKIYWEQLENGTFYPAFQPA